MFYFLIALVITFSHSCYLVFYVQSIFIRIIFILTQQLSFFYLNFLYGFFFLSSLSLSFLLLYIFSCCESLFSLVLFDFSLPCSLSLSCECMYTKFLSIQVLMMTKCKHTRLLQDEFKIEQTKIKKKIMLSLCVKRISH